MALSDVIGRLAEVNEEQLLETQNIKVEIESLSDRFASFIRIAEGEKLDKLEERREERKKSRGMGFTGRAKEAAQQAKQTGLTLIDLLVKGAGLAVAAGVIIPLLMQNEEVKEALGDLGTALGESVSLVLTKIAPAIGKILGDTLLGMLPGLKPKTPENVGPIIPEESAQISSLSEQISSIPSGDGDFGSQIRNSEVVAKVGEELFAGKNVDDINETSNRLRYLIKNDPNLSDEEKQRLSILIMSAKKDFNSKKESASVIETDTVNTPSVKPEEEQSNQSIQSNVMNIVKPGSYKRMMAAEEEYQNREDIRDRAKAISRSILPDTRLPDTSLQSMATLAAQSSMGMGEFNILKGLMNVFKDGKKREEIDALGRQSLDMMYPDLASDVFSQRSAIAQNVLYPSVSSKMPAISQLRGAASDGNNVTIINNNVTSGAGGGGGPSVFKPGVSYMSGESKFSSVFRSGAISSSWDLLGQY
jgi:hypothetical protein